MGYDNLLTKAGDFGLYQLLLSSIFVCYTTFLCGLNYYTQVIFPQLQSIRRIKPFTQY